jgi:MFS transporter, PAT family, beta-lactamase induction signal transducer AmpG
MRPRIEAHFGPISGIAHFRNCLQECPPPKPPHATLTLMPPALRPEADSQSVPPARDRPWLFAFLITPEAVISLGLVSGALTYLMRDQGVNPARAASIASLLSLPHAIFFLWGPLTDFWMRRRTWLLLAALAAAIALVAAFHQPQLASPLAVSLLFLSACLGVFVTAACGGILGTLHSELSRRRASSFYQTGSLAFGAIAVYILVTYSGRLSLSSLGWIVAAMIVVPSLFALLAPQQSMIREHGAHQTVVRIWHEFKSTFLRWEAIPYTLLVGCPCCSGAMIGLLPQLARDYHVTGHQVAWINGVAGALLTSAGALAASLIPIRIRAPIAFLLAGIANAATLAIFALGPLGPAVYFTGTVLFLFTIGAGYALFTGVALEFLGGSGKSGSSRYAIINSIGNLPVAYMTYLDGRGYALWGPRAMPAVDAIITAAGCLILLAHFAISRRRQSALAA